MAARSNSLEAWLSCEEWAKKIGITTQRARQLCMERGKDFGAKKVRWLNGAWLIPKTAGDPRMPVGRPRIHPIDEETGKRARIRDKYVRATNFDSGGVHGRRRREDDL